MGEPPDGGFSRLERMEDRMEVRMDDRVEVYEAQLEAQLDQKHYYGFSPTPYNYQVQSKTSLNLKVTDSFYLADYNSLQRRPPASPGTVNSRLGLPLCDNINLNRNSLRTPLLEDDRESCV